jgi:Ca2+-binding EF-hand superfamily protein
MHDNFKILQSGIDFETFHKCNSELCGEEEILVRKIYDEINTGASGMLTLEDYVDALTTMYRKDLIDQLEFFLRVFNMKGKHILTYDDVLHICQISIKRLITNNKNDISSIAVIKSISKFFANYMFELCNSNLNGGIDVGEIKNIIKNNKKGLEYIEIFCCSTDNTSKNKSFADVDNNNE